jgi:RTX calcium-binding nonapeptide repeat (4 copies)
VRIMKNLVTFALAALVLSACGAASAQAATFSDPAGDNCAGGSCGPDLTGVGYRVGADGTAYLSVSRAGSVCNTLSYPTTEVQPMFELLADGATSQADAGSYLGSVWAVSTTSDFRWTPQGGTTEVPLASTVSPGAVEVAIPPSIIASVGGLPLKLFVTNSCREFPFTPLLESKDIAPDTGLYRVEAPQAPDACRNIPGTQSSVPAGLALDGSGNCVADACPDIAGVQATVPAGYSRGPSGLCTQVDFTGTAGRDRIVGNALANTIRGGGGNDRLFGAAGADRLMGEAGADKLVGGPGRDRLAGGPGNDVVDGRDRGRRDVVAGGAGSDICYHDAGDILTGCERRIRA